MINPSLAAGQDEYFYPNNQGARMLWYHDHAIGTTRLNAYAGLASGYVMTDSYESLTMTVSYNLPGPLDPRTTYLIFQDKTLSGPNTATLDPTWPSLIPILARAIFGTSTSQPRAWEEGGAGAAAESLRNA